MIDAVNSTHGFALDVQGIGALRLQAKTDPDAALKSAVQQFEAVFMNMMLKSMRDSVDQDGLLDSEQTKQFTSMLDQQLSQSLSTKGIGLADVMLRQLKPQATPGQVAPTSTGAAPAPSAVDTPTPASDKTPVSSRASDFVNRLWPHAAAASRNTGISPTFMIGHAALESGWGKAEIRGADGSPSHNLFGIKAGRGWSGPVVEATTTEYVNGVAQKSVEKFRAYSSYAEGFKDYANMLRSNPRYASVIASGNDPVGFAAGLQQAGYATDPMYAEKLNRILQGSTLRQGLLG
ncbi:muramidase [Georgfuchsia toluolica]|uniref:Peptidoglycan hydrolase FlgJ n=1 Tax=Georgfuchsia toluolica TaxID=424218 RepID=A0A916J1N7_9PROT|nr:flagellar assembly peptidoglycan hydrolase FlgJ [Georgfuchsia toluolica]CAG4882181.1 muramidase [Georgfuchsia toluolica]